MSPFLRPFLRLDSHHLPAKSVNRLPPEYGPAIQMDPPDHWATGSNGRRAGSVEYREAVEALIDQNRWRDAMAMEIRDARRAALEVARDRTKYNGAIKEMLEYAYGLGLLNKR